MSELADVRNLGELMRGYQKSSISVEMMHDLVVYLLKIIEQNDKIIEILDVIASKS